MMSASPSPRVSLRNLTRRGDDEASFLPPFRFYKSPGSQSSGQVWQRCQAGYLGAIRCRGTGTGLALWVMRSRGTAAIS